MHSFLLVISGIFLAAVSVFGAPVDNFKARSLSPSEVADTLFERAVGQVLFGPHVPEEHKESITAAVQAHHDSLPAGHVAKNAAKAHVYGPGWHSNDNDPQTHATVKYYKDAALNNKNMLGTAHHVYQRSFSPSLDDAVFARAVGQVLFGPQVPEEHKASITAAVQAHHDSLPAGHVAKNAAKAHVYGPGWHSNDNDPATHATVKYYRDAALNNKNMLGTAHHVYQRSFSPSFDDAVFARAVGQVLFGPQVPEEHKASITAAVQAHHDTLPAGHVAKNAAKAHVYGPGWHANDNDPATHATVKYYRDAALNNKNMLGAAHHVYQT